VNPAATCTVWWAAPVGPAAAPGLVDMLDAHERERLARLRRDDDRARYLAAHALVRLVLAAILDRPAAALGFDRTCRCGQQHGKPRLAGAGPEFSLTHAGDLVGVAVHAGPVGLDVEQVRELPHLPAMAAHVCSPGESAPDTGAFFTLWTRKEALLKATGGGLATPMAAITLGPSGVAEWTGPGAPQGPVWLRDLRPGRGYRAAVAGLGVEPAELRERDGDAVLAAVAPGCRSPRG
jgi:4'-phosphopantetheinyl transferase